VNPVASTFTCNTVPLGGEPDGISPQESFNGDLLYFAAGNANTALRTSTLTGALPEARVDGIPPVTGENPLAGRSWRDLFRATGGAKLRPLFRFFHWKNPKKSSMPAKALATPCPYRLTAAGSFTHNRTRRIPTSCWLKTSANQPLLALKCLVDNLVSETFVSGD
jgi:hypothetical protein